MGEFGISGGGPPDDIEDAHDMDTAAAEQVDERSAAAAPTLRRRMLDRTRPHLVVAAVTAAALAFYLYHSLADQARYLTTGYDLGIFDQAIRAYSHFRAPMVPLKGSGYDIMGDHFHPIIALLAPLYWIWDNVNVLLIAQAALTAVSVPVVYRFARRRTSQTMSVIIATTYAFGWPIQGLIDFDFHEVAFATPLLALAIDALDRRDDRRLILWCALLLFVREDMGILVALIGALVLAQRRGARRLGFAMIAAGLLAYWLTTSFVIPHFASGHDFAYGNQFGELGHSIGSAAVNVVTQPWHAVRVFFTPKVKAGTLAWLLLPFAGVSLRSRYSLLAIPLLSERFFNERHNLWTTVFHYNALPWLVFCLAAIDGAQRLGFFDATRRAKILRSGLAAVMIGTPLLIILIGNKVLPLTSLRGSYAHQPKGWLASVKQVDAFLPDDVCVAADNHLAPHLTARDWTTVAQVNTPDPDFYAIDLFAPDTGGNPPAPKPAAVYRDATKHGYHVVLRTGTWVVLQSPNYTGPSSACRPLGPGK